MEQKEGSAPSDAIATTDNDNGIDVCEEAEAADEADHDDVAEAPAEPAGRFSWRRLLVYGVVPALALILALVAAYLKWQADSAALSQVAAGQSTQAASASTIAMLSYHPDTVEKDLTAAADRMTGTFRAEYTKLINDVVIPGAKQKKISAVATVPGAAPVSATKIRQWSWFSSTMPSLLATSLRPTTRPPSASPSTRSTTNGSSRISTPSRPAPRRLTTKIP